MAVLAAPYLIPFLFYFIVLALVLHGELRWTRLTRGGEIVRNIVMLAGGFVAFILGESIPLFACGTLLTPWQPLLAIVAYQFVPMYVIIASVSTYFFYKAGRVIPGALVNAMFVPLLIMTSTATQFPLHRRKRPAKAERGSSGARPPGGARIRR